MSPISVNTIIDVVASYYSITALELISHRRNSDVLKPRFVAIWMAKQHTSLSLPDIGKYFGGRDHTTILNATRRIDELCAVDAATAGEVAEIDAMLAGLHIATEALGLDTSSANDLDPEEIARRALISRRLTLSISAVEIEVLARAYLALLEWRSIDVNETGLREIQVTMDGLRRAFGCYRVALGTPAEGAALVDLTTAMRPVFFADEFIRKASAITDN